MLAFVTILTEPTAGLRSLSCARGARRWRSACSRGARRTQLQLFALAVAVMGAVAWGWAWIAPECPTGSLDRLVVILVVLTGAVAPSLRAGLVKLFRRETEWGCLRGPAAGTRIAGLGDWSWWPCSGARCWRLPGTVLRRCRRPPWRRLRPGFWGAAAAGLSAAVIPGRDPLGLSDRGRTAYVYGAEAMLGLGFMHIRLTMPWLFSGAFARYWPLCLLGLAFVGVGLSEVFRRQGRLVLA